MRVESLRTGFPAAAFAAALGLITAAGAGTASAQFGGRRGGGGGIGPGSTVQGDVLRGEGIAAMGFGQYNLATAMATSINVDSTIRWNQYVYMAIQEDLHQKYLHRVAHQERTNAGYNKNLERIRARPDQSDLRSGDALNAVLVQLLDPRISPSNYRRSVVPLPGDTIRKVPFHYAQRAATFSMERLIGKREWPLRLRDPEFAADRRAYERAVDGAIELDIEGRLTSSAVRRIEQAVDDFAAKVDRLAPETKTADLVQARNHLKRLADVPRLLNERAVERVIAEIETYPGTSVGDLIAFMQRHNLRFGVAESPDEHVLYAGLFDSLVQQREQVTLPQDGDQPSR